MDNLLLNAKRLFNITLTSDQMQMFKKYEEILLDWNTRMNLTAIRKPEDIRVKHFLDSMAPMLVWKDKPLPKNLIDVGTGAGFPGIVLKILIPSLHLTLIESIGKKADFCSHLVQELNLRDVEILQERSEVVAHKSQYREKYEAAVSRAVASLPILVEYLMPFVKIGGNVIAMKGNRVREEVEKAATAYNLIGANPHEPFLYTLPGESDPRTIVVIGKAKRTSDIYPRAVGIPTKNPL